MRGPVAALERVPQRAYMRAMERAPDSLPFMKMHGLGNDFVVLDARAHPPELTPALVQAIADRHRGVGFDQLAVIGTGAGDATLTFYNADGSTAQHKFTKDDDLP